MPKTYEYWQRMWRETKGSEFDKALKLFEEYSQASILGTGAAKAKRFLHGRNTTHGDQVAEAIKPWQSLGSNHIALTTEQDPNVLVKIVMEKVKKVENPEGDLAKILEVIKKETEQKSEDTLDSSQIGPGRK